jgi:hypothetical protein
MPVMKLSVLVAMHKPVLGVFALVLGLGLAQATQAQLYSYDGNRWYEVEVVVFKHVTGVLNVSETPAPAAETPDYLPNLRELAPEFASYMVDFPLLSPAAFEAASAAPAAMAVQPVAPVMGPEFSPAVERGFKLEDLGRDGFIALGRRESKLTRELQRLQESPDYDVLWHSVWRQPMQGSAQTPAIFVNGGDSYGEHRQLEGSLRFTDSGGSVQLDLELWLGSFQAGTEPEDNEWVLPEFPFADEKESTDEQVIAPAATLDLMAQDTVQNWFVDSSWMLSASRQVENGELYYLDNPALGVLLQVRAYELPSKNIGASEEDF